MKIAILASHYAPDTFGGAEISTQLLAESLSRSGVDVVVICTRQNITHEEENVNGVRVRPVLMANIYHPLSLKPHSFAVRAGWHIIDRNNPVMAARVRSILQEEKPDILHTQTLAGFSGSVWSAAASLQIPVAHTLRSYYLLCPRETMRRGNQNCSNQCTSCLFLTSVKKQQSRLVQGVIGISQFILDKHVSSGYFSQAAKQVIHNPVALIDTRSVFPDGQQSQDTEESYPSTQMVRLGFLGRLHETKGLEPVLKELRRIPLDSFSFQIAGTGDPSYVAKLKELARGLPVQFLGHVSPNNFFKEIDLLIVSSLWNEPFGRITIESFSYGVPVVATRNGGTSELVVDGETGFFFDPFVSGSLCSTVQNFAQCREKQAQMKRNVREEAQKFDSQKIAESHLQFYKQLIETCSLQ